MRDIGGPAGAGALVLAALEFRHMLHEPCMCHVKNELETYGGLLYAGALAFSEALASCGGLLYARNAARRGHRPVRT